MLLPPKGQVRGSNPLRDANQYMAYSQVCTIAAVKKQRPMTLLLER